jgi:histidinol-phosphatase (PHP family)
VIVDYHMHLRAPDESIDHSLSAVERFVRTAEGRGVDEIGFTEHVYYFTQTSAVWSLPYQLERCRYDLDRYCDAVLEAQRRGLPVKLGLEVDYVADRHFDLVDVLRPYPWDFLLGSVHWIDGLAVDSEPGLWDRVPVEEVWRLYFAALREAAGTGFFDILAHPDLVKIFGRRPLRDLIDAEHAATADAVAEAGVCVEISTAGLHKAVGELYPDAELLAAFRERGVPITLASDAHVPANVGRDFEAATALARSVGYDTVTVFAERRRAQAALG